jgi:hypothetical protein
MHRTTWSGRSPSFDSIAPSCGLDCDGRVMLHLADLRGTLGQTWGPFEQLSSIGGVTYTDGRKFATFDEANGVWTIEPSGLRCPILVARSPS